MKRNEETLQGVAEKGQKVRLIYLEGTGKVPPKRWYWCWDWTVRSARHAQNRRRRSSGTEMSKSMP